MNIGEKIKSLRVKLDLTQEELANRAELSKGFISQLERDLTSPSITTLVDILECLGTDLKEFFSENVDEKIVYTKEDIFIKNMQEIGCEIKWLITNAQKNELEPILVVLSPVGKSELDYPHEGEEFGYVLSGTICLHIGTRKFKVKKGDSFNFKPTDTHYIENLGKSEATVLWVSTPPSF